MSCSLQSHGLARGDGLRSGSKQFKLSRSRTISNAYQAAKATVVDAKPCTLDNSVRQLTLAVHDPVDYMSGRYMVPKAVEPRWLDNYLYPGQKVELTTDEGNAVPVVICSSPSEARNESGVGNFSMINVLVQKEGESSDIYAADVDQTFEISRIHGPGFSNPVNDEIKLTSILEEKRPVIIVASGAGGIGTARSAICWDALAASATECPVVVVYIVEAKESAAFMLEWDSWKAMGVHLIPVYIFDGDSDTDGDNGGNGNKAKLLPQQDSSKKEKFCRVLLQMEALFAPGGEIHELMKGKLADAAALFSGLSHEESKTVLRCLKLSKIRGEHILQS